MRILKPGDPCPFCGQPILTEDPQALRLLAAAADIVGLPENQEIEGGSKELDTHDGCEGCAFAVLLSGEWYCDYLLMTGHRRPCPPGEGCTVRKAANLTKKESAFMRRRAWDTDDARALYDQRLSDNEIAKRIGVTASAVACWRRGLGLPANGASAGAQPGGSSEELRSLPQTAPPGMEKGPVALSFEYQDCALVIKASDMEGVRQIYKYAGRILAGIGRAPGMEKSG